MCGSNCVANWLPTWMNGIWPTRKKPLPWVCGFIWFVDATQHRALGALIDSHHRQGCMQWSMEFVDNILHYFMSPGNKSHNIAPNCWTFSNPSHRLSPIAGKHFGHQTSNGTAQHEGPWIHSMEQVNMANQHTLGCQLCQLCPYFGWKGVLCVPYVLLHAARYTHVLC